MIHIDLRNLTDDLVAEAIPHLGECRYAAPCIIGALIPVEERDALDRDEEGDEYFPQIASLIDDGKVELPDHQRYLAMRLQSAFDSGDRERFDTALAYVRKELNIHA